MIKLKNDEEIRGIRKSCHLLADMFNFLIPKVRDGVGMSTKDIDDLALKFIREHGGTPAWYMEDFPGAICVSVNDQVIHGIPSKKRILKEGDIVSLDGGINLGGFISDSCHSVIVGRPIPEVKKLDDVALECLAAGIQACRVGNRISDISRAVYDIAEKHGYGVVYDYCGHGVGLEVHEDPSIPNVPSGGPNPRIQPGMVLAIEPMINLGVGDVYVGDDGWTVYTEDHRASAHEEHTVAVFEDHTEILTDLNYAKN